MSATMPLADHPLIDQSMTEFDAVQARLPGNGVSWLEDLRRSAIQQFATLGLPTTRDEDWKYTSLRPLEKYAFETAGETCIGLMEDDLGPALMPQMPSHRLVFINGLYAPQLSKPGKVQEGIRIGSLARALRDNPDDLKLHLGQIANSHANGFAALNTAFINDGAYIHLARGKAVEQPVHLVFIATPHQNPTSCYARNLIVAEANSQAKIVESYFSMGDSVYLTNSVTEAVLQDNAHIDHYKLQQESSKAFHISTLQVHQQRDSQFTSHSVSVGASLARNDINVKLDAVGADCMLNGLYIANGRQHVDYHTRVDHCKPHGASHEFYKGVLGGRARAVFNGRVYVHPDAQKTDAQQSNKNLLLSKDAEVDTKPQLEIYADDVKCSHGATVGQMDETMLFYLRTRGIDPDVARGMLTYGFAHDIVDRMDIEPIRDRVETLLLSNLPNAEQIQAML